MKPHAHPMPGYRESRYLRVRYAAGLAVEALTLAFAILTVVIVLGLLP